MPPSAGLKRVSVPSRTSRRWLSVYKSLPSSKSCFYSSAGTKQVPRQIRLASSGAALGEDVQPLPHPQTCPPGGRRPPSCSCIEVLGKKS